MSSEADPLLLQASEHSLSGEPRELQFPAHRWLISMPDLSFNTTRQSTNIDIDELIRASAEVPVATHVKFSRKNDIRHLRPTNPHAKRPTPEHFQSYRDAILLFACILGYVCFGASVMAHLEGWPFLHAVQFTVVTLTTVGYGNLTPTTAGAKMFTCFYLLAGLNLLAVILGSALANLENAQRTSQKAVVTFGVSMSVHIRAFLRNLLVVFLIVAAGVIYYTTGQGLNGTDAFYFTIETLTTVGYGDTGGVDDKTTGEWWFSIFFVSFGVISFTSCLGNIASAVAEIKIRRQMQSLVKAGITLEMIEKMDSDGSGDVDRLEFLSSMLVQWGRCSAEDILCINEIFDSLDVDGGGTLDAEDIRT